MPALLATVPADKGGLPCPDNEELPFPDTDVKRTWPIAAVKPEVFDRLDVLLKLKVEATVEEEGLDVFI